MQLKPRTLLIALCFLQSAAASAEKVSSVPKPKPKPPLTFRTVTEKGENNNPTGRTYQYFKILQLADIHYGEGPGTNWGERQDAKSIELIQSLLQTESPDLVVLSGDQLTADFIKEGATAVQKQLVQAMVDVQPNVRWCLVMGNHDDHPFETFLDNGVVLTDPTTTRRDLLYFDASLGGSVTVAGDKSIYKLPILYDIDGSSERDSGVPAAEIFIFDTGGGMIREEIDQEQVDWFVEQTQTRSSEMPDPIPAIAFQHIASNADAWAFSDGECSGIDEESNRVKTVKKDPGLFQAMMNYEDLHFVGVGHNHGKSYCCDYQDLHSCYGRHSGYGGYEKVDRGGRIYELRIEVEEESSIFSWESWVRLEDGSVVDRYRPNYAKEYPLPAVQTERATLAPSPRPTIVEVDTFSPSMAFTESPSVDETYQPSLSSSVAPSEAKAVVESNLPTKAPISVTTQVPTDPFAPGIPSSGRTSKISRSTLFLSAIGLGHALFASY